MAKVIITGATGGFGFLTISRLLQDGHQVVGTARDINGKNKSKVSELASVGAQIIEMDITQDASVKNAIEAAAQRLGGIDVVINNAGVGVLGLTEAFTIEDFKRVFDVNVFGVQRVSREILPHMRKAGKGLIINVSSLLGRITVPFYGPYNATKWALEGLTENYRSETSQFNIEVCLVEPGGYPTTFIDNLIRPSDKNRSKEYGPMGEMAEGFLKGFEQALASNPAQDPNDVAAAIANLVKAPHGNRPFRTMVDKMGMADALSDYNGMLNQVTERIYGNFGIAHLLKVQTK